MNEDLRGSAPGQTSENNPDQSIRVGRGSWFAAFFRMWSSGSRISACAAAMVVFLAAGAILWPTDRRTAFQGVCLVYDSAGGAHRETVLFSPLVHYLAETTGRSLDLVVARNVAEFQAQLDLGADFIICPDGLGLEFDSEEFVPLVAGRRTAPRNLRPRSVMVFRVSAGQVKSPWLTRAEATIFGDSLSLCATGVLRGESQKTGGLPAGCAYGPDPYDHSVVLHALRFGSFDYALVRQWDAERFFAEGLLPHEVWGMEILTGPVPDLTLFISRDIPAGKFLDLSRDLGRLGRIADGGSPEGEALVRSLAQIHLSGFNLLVEPDFDLVRSSFPGNWPPAAP